MDKMSGEAVYGSISQTEESRNNSYISLEQNNVVSCAAKHSPSARFASLVDIASRQYSVPFFALNLCFLPPKCFTVWSVFKIKLFGC